MSLAELIGQPVALRILEAALQGGKISSAYLFYGPPGVGKRFAAMGFAQLLLCQSPRGLRPCGDCPACRLLQAGTHPDLLVLEPSGGMLRVDEVRALQEALALKPLQGRRKVALLKEAHTMNPQAANAFLKTLEEPPGESTLILCTPRAAELPATIRSRCTPVPFRPLREQHTMALLEERYQGPELRLLARLCMGRPGLALRENPLLARQKALQALGSMGQPGKAPWADHQELQEFLDILGLLLRDALVLKLTSEQALLINQDLAGPLAKMAKRATEKGIIECYQRISALKAELVFNLNRNILFNYIGSLLREFELEVSACN